MTHTHKNFVRLYFCVTSLGLLERDPPGLRVCSSWEFNLRSKRTVYATFKFPVSDPAPCGWRRKEKTLFSLSLTDTHKTGFFGVSQYIYIYHIWFLKDQKLKKEREKKWIFWAQKIFIFYFHAMWRFRLHLSFGARELARAATARSRAD